MHDPGLSSLQQILTHLIQTVHRLRAPDGCPWDRAQTHQSLRPHLIEEAYEVMDVLDQISSPDDLKRPTIKNDFKEELGDLLMQVLLHAEMASETGAFDFYQVAQGLDEKLIRRHPHVFAEATARDEKEALANWEQSKAKEKAPHQGVLDGLPKNLPSLQRATRLIEKVTKVGFQWEDMNGPLAKVDEELEELKTEVLALEQLNALHSGVSAKNQDPDPVAAQKAELKQKVSQEMGDLLFTLCNVSFLLGIDPENALRSTLQKFTHRFRHVDQSVKGHGKTFKQANLKEMDQYWKQAKQQERFKIIGLTGGIGSGKSEAATLFRQMGIPVVSADAIGQSLLSSNEVARTQINERFKTLDPRELKKIIFADPAAKKDLEAILHPMVYVESFRQMRELGLKHPVVLYEAAILVEAGRTEDLDGLIVIEAPRQLRIERVCKRDAITAELAEQIISSQASDELRARHATHIVTNATDLSDLRKQLLELKL